MRVETQAMVELGRQALWLVMAIAAPVVLVALGVGFVVSVLQAASQIQEFTLSFVPKILAVLLTLAVCAPWMGEQLVRFARLALSGDW
jgi:flagellar biosynthetic protein FliQ